MTAVCPPNTCGRRGMILGVASIVLAVAQIPWCYFVFMISYAILGGDNGTAGIGIGSYVLAFGLFALASIAGTILGIMANTKQSVQLWKSPGLYGLLLNALWIIGLTIAVVAFSR